MSTRNWLWRTIRPCGFALAISALGQLVGVACAHDDVRPKNDAGKVATDGYDDGTGITTPDVRVFGYDFGEDPADPFFTQDPGFNSLVGSGLQAGALSFDVLGPASGSGLPFNLSYWDGAGAVTWTSVPMSEQLRWNRGANNLLIGSTSTPLISGFSIGTVAGAGSIHQHLNAFINGSDGNSIPAGPGDWGAGDAVEAAPGIYALSIVLKNGSLANSDPIWIVYNNGLDEESHDAAIEWVNAHAVPEPTSWILSGLGGVLLLFVGRRIQRRAEAAG